MSLRQMYHQLFDQFECFEVSTLSHAKLFIIIFIDLISFSTRQPGRFIRDLEFIKPTRPYFQQDELYYLFKNPTSLKIRISLINEVTSLSSPVIASIPGSVLFKNESSEFSIKWTWQINRNDNKMKYYITVFTKTWIKSIRFCYLIRYSQCCIMSKWL